MVDDSHPRSAPSESPGLIAEADGADVRIRPLISHEDYQACVALQREVWGPEYEETIPASLLQVASYVGGLIAGAFGSDGDLLGFVFGLTGVKNGETLHWSHALGVREAARNSGVGRMLKEYQRSELARRAVGVVYWTFDPLIAKNAHFNINRLGARVVEYIPNMYGTTKSPLHHGLATDRFVVVCSTTPRPAKTARRFAAQNPQPRILTTSTHPDDILFAGALQLPRAVWIEVPTDIHQVLADSPAAAAEWHSSIRRHFQWALGNRYAVTGFQRDPVTSRSFYTLELKPATP